MKMSKELRNLLKTVVTGNHDLLQETIEASKKILEGGYEGHQEDIDYLKGIETGFELERLLSQGKWYWQEDNKMNDIEEVWTDYCPECNMYCKKKFIDGICE